MSTHEVAQYEAAWLIKDQHSHLSPFSRDTLFLSLLNCIRHRDTAIYDAGALTDTIIAKLLQTTTTGVIDSKAIVQTTLVALGRFDKVASIQYQAFHAL